MNWVCVISFTVGGWLGGSSVWAQTSTSSPPPTHAEANDPQYEYNVKAAFLYSFGRYIEWPEEAFENPKSPFIIGIYGDNPFGETINRIAQTKVIQGRRIQIRKISTAEEAIPCHILFIPQTVPHEEQVKMIREIKQKPVLLVGESTGFTDQGGNVNFFLEEDRVRFEINSEEIYRDHLRIDAKLLSLGKKIATNATP